MAKAPAKGTKKKTFKKKEKRIVHVGIVHIQATFNNTIVTIADPEGNTVSWSSAGSLGFRGSRKGTPFAAQQAALTAANKANEVGLAHGGSTGERPGFGPRIGGARAGDGGSGCRGRFAIPRRFRTTAAGRRKSAEFRCGARDSRSSS